MPHKGVAIAVPLSDAPVIARGVSEIMQIRSHANRFRRANLFGLASFSEIILTPCSDNWLNNANLFGMESGSVIVKTCSRTLDGTFGAIISLGRVVEQYDSCGGSP